MVLLTTLQLVSRFFETPRELTPRVSHLLATITAGEDLLAQHESLPEESSCRCWFAPALHCRTAGGSLDSLSNFLRPAADAEQQLAG